jgi:hypothetical protein
MSKNRHFSQIFIGVNIFKMITSVRVFVKKERKKHFFIEAVQRENRQVVFRPEIGPQTRGQGETVQHPGLARPEEVDLRRRRRQGADFINQCFVWKKNFRKFSEVF